jgi:hypothetical protein
VPLGSAVVVVRHQEDLDQEVEEGIVIQQLLPDESTRAVGVGVLQVELAEDPVGVAL